LTDQAERNLLRPAKPTVEIVKGTIRINRHFSTLLTLLGMKKPSHLSLILVLCAVLLLFGLVWAACRPNFVHSGPGTMSGIINNLRQIQGAKEQWAFENHETNDVVVTREMLDGIFGRGGYDAFVRPVAHERYTINTLWKPAEAELTKKVGGHYPRGTVVRLGTNAHEEIILPNQQGGANGRQPFSSETNQTSAPAASRRSP
jgi:hypothetical protein